MHTQKQQCYEWIDEQLRKMSSIFLQELGNRISQFFPSKTYM